LFSWEERLKGLTAQGQKGKTVLLPATDAWLIIENKYL
jgi:hypothetical protein